jgi:hypothetical protein
MPNIASALRAEISRIVRKEIRPEAGALKKAVAGHRRAIAALKRQVQTLERQAKSGIRKRMTPAAAHPEEQSERQLRFSATRLAAQRKKLGLSAANFALLVGVPLGKREEQAPASAVGSNRSGPDAR